MSFDDYAEHIYQKHRLCVALAVLKAKPPDLTSTEYITLLQSKMADSNDDNDVTVCSDDFIMDEGDDSDTILKDFNDERIGGLGNNETLKVLNDRRHTSNVGEGSKENLSDQLTQTTHCHSVKSQIEPGIDNDVTYYDNDVTYYDNDCTTDKNLDDKSNLNDKDIDHKINNNLVYNNALFSDESNIKCSNNNELNKLTDSNYDTQKTILYTVHGFTQNYTHYSPSQNDILIPNKYLYRTNEDKTEPTLNTNSNGIADALNSGVTNINSLTNTKPGNIETDNRSKDGHRHEVVSEDRPSESILANRNIILFSQNMNEVYRENENDLTKSTFKDNNDENKKNNFSEGSLDCSQNVHDYLSEIHSINDNNFNNINNENKIENKKPKDTFESTRITTGCSQKKLNIDHSYSNNSDTIQSIDTGKHINEIMPNQNTGNSTQNFGKNIYSSQKHTQEIAPFESIEEESDTVEVIPYKILEELNKIKMFLRRKDRRLSCDGYSTDSGYRSDSQLRSSNRSALQLSGIAINQSAYCLFNHIVQCPLVGVTREITSEIAQTLGQLIDRLHEEETYPQFLEELLDTVDILLRQVYKGQSYDDNEFLKKDEFVQRILLLNKSIHIQSHSIEKITSILKKFHEIITDNNVTYELTNIDEVENASYLFHILEILLKRYIKNKDTLSQNSQVSQEEDKILNKSSITEIWRKKWNPNFKENSAGSREDRCVLKKCSEILNKIIVDCVNSYSLIAYSALKCFNSMQS